MVAEAIAAPRTRLPAYGRRLKEALDSGLRPATGGGGIIVTSEWDYARGFAGGRVVCPPDDPPESFDLRFLRGCDVLVLVRERDEQHGRALLARIKEAGASLGVLAVDREPIQ